MTDPQEAPAFVTGEGLRRLLARINETGRQAWRRDPEVQALAVYTVAKYERLCRKWDRDPAEAAAAAFHAMQGDYILTAAAPWAIVTIAVRNAVIAEAQAEKLLIAPDRARQKDTTGWEAPVRAGEYDDFLLGPAMPQATPDADSPLLARIQHLTTQFFVILGWPEPVAAAAIEYVLTRTLAVMDADRAQESLRRDDSMPALLDLPPGSWRALVRILLGGRAEPGIPARRGLVARIALQDPAASSVDHLAELLDDDELVLAVFEARP